MTRTVVVLAVASLVAAVSCRSEPQVEPGLAPSADPPPVLPAAALPRMTSRAATVDVDGLVGEVVHPDDLRVLLEDAGFAAGAERSFGGGTGAFSRVLARALAFDTEAGAAAFVRWFGDHAHEEIITAERISPVGVPQGVVVFSHEPDGCCHNDVPVFLAAWQQGSSVLYLHVGGRRANTRAFVDLISSYDREV